MLSNLLGRLRGAGHAARSDTGTGLLSPYVAQRREAQSNQYFSRYGGLWVDLPDAQDIAAKLAATKVITEREHELVGAFMTNGYVVLERAINPALIDEFGAEVDRLWTTGHPELMLGLPPNDQRAVLEPKYASIVGVRMLDAYRHLESARNLLLHDRITRFLRIVFNRSPLLFQSLSFPIGSEQGMHQDTAYVVTGSPMELAASWIALEDIAEGSGELQYYVGSHRVPEYHFSGNRKHYAPGVDAPAEQDEFLRQMNGNAIKMGCKLEKFRAKKGDVLIWHADLVHGGAPITNPQSTRKSLVGHYCPDNVQPNYFEFLPNTRTIYSFGAGSYCSGIYPKL